MAIRIPIALFEEWLAPEAEVLTGEGQLVLRFRDDGTTGGFEIIARREDGDALFEDCSALLVRRLGAARLGKVRREALAVVQAFATAALRQSKGLQPFVAQPELEVAAGR
jgi:hypothetical protein